MADKPNQHVVPHEDGWAVMKDGVERASFVFATKAEAVTKAREIARNQEVELLVHKSDGTIQEKYSYGYDPEAIEG